MHVSRLMGSSLQNACSIVPTDIMNSADMVLGCKDNEVIAGVAAIIKKDDEWGLIWLYVLPQYRRKGAGSMLLDAMISMAEQEGVSILSSVMEADIADWHRIELMLARRQFLLTWKTVDKIRITIEQLRNAPILTAYPKYHLGDNRIMSLGKVSSLALNNFIKEAERKGNLLVSRADYKNADGAKSMVLEKDGIILGVLLLQTAEKRQLHQVKLCYVDRHYKMYIVFMIQRAAEAILNNPGGTEAIEFTCMDDSIVKLGKHIFPEHELLKSDIIVGECWL